MRHPTLRHHCCKSRQCSGAAKLAVQDTYRNHCTHCVLRRSANVHMRPRRQVCRSSVAKARRQSLPALQCPLHPSKFKGDCGDWVNENVCCSRTFSLRLSQASVYTAKGQHNMRLLKKLRQQSLKIVCVVRCAQGPPRPSFACVPAHKYLAARYANIKEKGVLSNRMGRRPQTLRFFAFAASGLAASATACCCTPAALPALRFSEATMLCSGNLSPASIVTPAFCSTVAR